MKRKWIFFIAPPALVLFIGICGEVIMHLWNWLLPSLFGWRAITFWQSLGLLLLSRILFGSWHGGRDRSGHRRDRAERWERMTPEEREKFRQGLGSRCGFGAGGFRPHDSEPGTPA
jgi:hypothetical protein